MIRRSLFRDQFEVSLAWSEVTPSGKKSLQNWCLEHHVKPAESLEAVVEESDCLLILAPSHPERHEELSALALKSGKPVYIDKPLASSLKIAQSFFKEAASYRTPLMSCSALRYAPALQKALEQKDRNQGIISARACGNGSFLVYAIHQLEMVVMALGGGAKRVIWVEQGEASLLQIEYGDERQGELSLKKDPSFKLALTFRNGVQDEVAINDFFDPFIQNMLKFFETGNSLIPTTETLEIIALLEVGIRAQNFPGQWIEL